VVELNLKFTDSQNQKIVDAILAGLRSYVEERKRKAKEMLVSDGYAWTRSNHIDTALGNYLQEINITYLKKKSSGWGYLEFLIEDQKILFLVKSQSFVKTFQDKSRNNTDHYIREFAKSNDHLVESTHFQNRIVHKQLSLNLGQFPNTSSEKLKDIDRSYIIVYTIGEVGMVESIRSYLPNSMGDLYQVEDLTRYIESSKQLFSEEERSEAKVIFSDDKSDDTNIFTFEIIGDIKDEKEQVRV